MKNSPKNTNKILLFVLCAVFFAVSLLVSFSAVHAQNLNIEYPPIRVPGGIFDINKAVQLGKVDIPQLIILIYAGIVLFSGIAAFVTLIYAGAVYIVSGGNPGKRKQAFQKFKNVWLGVGILFFSWFVLYIINPNIVDLERSLVLQSVRDEGNDFKSISFTNPELEERGTYSCEWVDGQCQTRENNCRVGYSPQCGGLTGDISEASDKCNSIGDARCGAGGAGGDGSSGGDGSGDNGGGAVPYCYERCLDEGNTPIECSGLDPCPDIACPVLDVTSSGTAYCYDRGHQRHNGHDIMANAGTPIYAMEAGTLDRVAWSNSGGCRLWIINTDSGRGYAHLHMGTRLDCSNAYGPGIQTGAQVSTGQLLGYVGTTYNGSASGTVPHLHLTIVKSSGSEECSPQPLSGNYGAPSMDGAPLFQQADCPFQ